ncbi:SCO3374 family protein [Streptomyces sannanensis]|uniref:SCO3374 family protein n=1 Tax=Streptomyces sannanensis TaxID=285536 RepID=A0ABP6SE58_9ACTN
MASSVPVPRTPPEDGGGVTRWYERELGWAVTEGPPPQLVTGVRFDVLELPAPAGVALLGRIGSGAGPVALVGRGALQRMQLLVAAGCADELPGLLEWLQWGGIALDLTAIGAGGRIIAPVPPGRPDPCSRGAAVWLRPPEPRHEVEPALPSVSPLCGRGAGSRGNGAPDLVRLVDAAATECHRARLFRAKAAGNQTLAFS